MTTGQRDTILVHLCTPGDFIFNLTTLLCQVWDGTRWKDVGAGSGVVTGAYEGNGDEKSGLSIDVGGPLQYLRIMASRFMPTPGYVNYAERYDVWQDREKGTQYWVEYRTVEGHGMQYYVHEITSHGGIVFTTDGFELLGTDALLNNKGTRYTYFAVLSDGRDKSSEYHIPEVAK